LTVTALQVTWISSLRSAAPTRMLHQITIPGTHDSGTFRLGSLSKCQSMSLEEQLLGGVRFFDIRVDRRTNALKIIHGDDLLTGYVFDDFANMVSRFLKATEETIVMQVHDERGNASGLHALIIQMMESALNPDQWRLYAAPIRMDLKAIPTLADLKGRAVLIRRYPYSQQEDAKAGTPVDLFGSGADFNFQSWSMPQEAGSWAKYGKLDWPDGGKGWSGTNAEVMGPGVNDCRNRHGLSFVIQDKYSIEDLIPPPGGSNADAKFLLVKQYLDGAAQGAKPDSWFLNYASCTEYMGRPENYAVIVNAGLMNYFAVAPRRTPLCGFGTIMMDFVDTGLLGFVIRSNWPI
jgi:Phosphatidylinositol-specific phospholipase C, X domain